MPEFNAEVTPRMRETMPSVAAYFLKCLNLGFTNFKCARQILTRASFFTKIKRYYFARTQGKENHWHFGKIFVSRTSAFSSIEWGKCHLLHVHTQCFDERDCVTHCRVVNADVLCMTNDSKP